MTDVHLFDTQDGGDVLVETGADLALTPGLESAAYISLFGGNAHDTGRPDDSGQWWGNHLGAEVYRSKTQHLLSNCMPIPANLNRLKLAAESDLEWMASEGLAAKIEVEVSMPAVRRVQFVVTIDGNEKIQFAAHWEASI